MKLFFLLFLIISSLTINAQNKTQLNLAVYDFRFSEDAQLASLFLDNVRYVIFTDGEVSILTGSVNSESAIPGVELKIEGPTEIAWSIRENLVKPDSVDSLYQYDNIVFNSVAKDTVINNYRCYTVCSTGGDTLFLSKQLPYYINPFLLSKETIQDGVVLGILKGSGSFTLTQLRQKESEPLVFPGRRDLQVVRGKNIYFK